MYNILSTEVKVTNKLTLLLLAVLILHYLCLSVVLVGKKNAFFSQNVVFEV